MSAISLGLVSQPVSGDWAQAMVALKHGERRTTRQLVSITEAGLNFEMPTALWKQGFLPR
jgi:hypothetical protein